LNTSATDLSSLKMGCWLVLRLVHAVQPVALGKALAAGVEEAGDAAHDGVLRS
jgi:hypothetical protein